MKHVILALDQAATSGYSLWLSDAAQPFGVLISSGTAKNHTERAAVLDAAEGLAKANDAQLHVVFEDHSKVPARLGMPTATILGMGDARGRWHEQLDLRGHSKARRYQVAPKVWRTAVLGAFIGSAKTEVAKKAAVQHASALTHRECTSHDAAEAVCIGQYAANNMPAIIAAHIRSVGAKHGAVTKARRARKAVG